MADAAKAGRSTEVDSLRAFAMLSVLALHSHLLPMGWIGVWLFFVISGYVVTLSIVGQDREERPFARLGGFLRRRSARILPVYYLYIGIGIASALALGLQQDGLSIASLALFFNNAAMIVGSGHMEGWPTGHLWTLSTEMQFYALYGTALCLLPRHLTRALLIALLLLCPVARLLVGQWLAEQGWRSLDAAFFIYAGPGLHFDIFAMGALLAFARTARPDQRSSRALLPVGLVATALYCTAYVAINIIIRHQGGIAAVQNVISGILYGQLREVFLYSAIGLLMTGVVAFAAEGARGLGGWVLCLPVLQWIGRISYGGYLFHPLGLKLAMMMLALVGVHTRGGGMKEHLVQFAVALPLTLLLAWLSWHWFETPMRRLIDGGGKRKISCATTTHQQLGLEAS